MRKTKRNFISRALLGGVLMIASCFVAGVGANALSANADDGSVVTDISQMESRDNGMTMLLHLTESDYMTASEWGTESTEAYKWVDTLTYEDRENHNVCNAILDKNLEAYNFADYITIDGVALKEYSYVLMANKYTCVNSLGITFPTAVLTEASEIVVQAGCQLPSLTHSYFGKEWTCMETQEDLVFTKKNGNWVKGYPFYGYEAETEYDANERYFYLRNQGSSYKGHVEAPTYDFTDIFSVNAWGDDGYTLASTADTLQGTLFVADLVHPIDANEFNAVKIRLFSNVDRSLAAYNPTAITEDSLGEAVESFSVTAKKFTTITLSTAPYADENGMIERFVFQFLDNGSENYSDNQFFLGSFSCLDNYYHLSFPMGIQGELTGSEVLDTSKVLINGESVDAINRHGKFAEAKWAVNEGCYEIQVKLAKTYDGKGAVKNADLGYTGNSIQALKGLPLPNGQALDRSYTYRMYEGECFIDYELIDEYEETQATGVNVRIEPTSNNNIRFMIAFDKKVTLQPYYHACETEEWREKSLVVFKGMYDKDVSTAYVAGGFKSAFYDKILINGISVGEWHAIDDLPTCVHVHYGQTDLYTLDMSIDSYSEMYAPIYEAFQNGEDITIEIKSGMKFTTGTQTTKDYRFVINGYTTTMEKEADPIRVTYDGKTVENGDVLHSSTKAIESNIFVQGTEGYSVTKTVDGDVVRFTLVFAGGEQFTFSVQENIVNEIPNEDEGGCSSNLSAGNVAVTLVIVAAFAGIKIRRKRYE